MTILHGNTHVVSVLIVVVLTTQHKITSMSFCRCSALLLCPLWPGYWSYPPGWLALQ